MFPVASEKFAQDWIHSRYLTSLLFNTLQLQLIFDTNPAISRNFSSRRGYSQAIANI